MNPRRWEKPLSGDYALEVDVKKDDCNREPPHVHLTFRGRRIGQIWTESATFERLPSDAPSSIINDAIYEVERNRWEINEVSNDNRQYGAY